MMKLLIDCSALQVGGGIQVGRSFLYDLQEIGYPEDTLVILSPQMSEQLSTSRFSSNFKFTVLEKEYYKNIISRGKKLKSIENAFQPDINFTVFGPSYYKSSVPKIVGYAIPHYIYKDSPYFSKLNFKTKLRLKIEEKLKVNYFTRNSDYLIFETQDAAQRFCKRFSFPYNKTHVVSNTINEIFTRPDDWQKTAINVDSEKFNIICITANYLHKNFKIIPQIIETLLKKNFINFKFIISLTKEQADFEAKYDQYVEFVGRVPLEELPDLYSKVDVVFMPTLLEVFSATYLEAMFMKKPLISTDLSFARDICGDSALFFDPESADAAAEAFIKLNENKGDIISHYIEKGTENLKRFGNSLERTDAYLKIINQIYNNEYSK